MKMLVLWTSMTSKFTAGVQSWLYPTCKNHVVLLLPSLQTVESMYLEECQVHEAIRVELESYLFQNLLANDVILNYLLNLMQKVPFLLHVLHRMLFNFTSRTPSWPCRVC